MKRITLTLLSVIAIAGSAWSQDTNADNTGNNKNATDGSSVTAGEQSNDPADIKTTADIRKMVMADDSLSALAKNVKIITVNQTVTLRGPVKTEKEKMTILAHAKSVGPKEVKNEITIKQ
jgi:hyperosmotically inducible periplasmic protein